MKLAKGFERGSGCYSCAICSRKTRATDEESTAMKLCYMCWELGLFETRAEETKNNPESFEHKYAVSEVTQIKTLIASKGGVL